jgi:hypothetical protein
MIESANELRARQEIADRVARADRRRVTRRAKAARHRLHRTGLEFL